MREDGRKPEELRPVKITPGFTKHAEGSVLIEVGDTRIICTASIDHKVPPWLKDGRKGWVTAEYGMLPRATTGRTVREASRGKPSGRTQEIQRLIGRSLRAIVDRTKMGERTIWVDCDVIQADGGTRTAAITGGFVALALAAKKMYEMGWVNAPFLTDQVAATSVGVVAGETLLDLAYTEDSKAEVDMNIVRTGAGAYVEVQGTAESNPFPRETLDRLLVLADQGIDDLLEVQRAAIGDEFDRLVIGRNSAVAGR